MTDDETVKRIAAFVSERDEMLLKCDVDAAIAFMKKQYPNRDFTISREAAELGLHKAITGARSLPLEFRLKSQKWLEDHGSTGLDDEQLK